MEMKEGTGFLPLTPKVTYCETIPQKTGKSKSDKWFQGDTRHSTPWNVFHLKDTLEIWLKKDRTSLASRDNVACEETIVRHSLFRACGHHG